MRDNNFTMTPEYVRRNIKVIHQEDGGLHQCFSDYAGEVISTAYDLFPGVVLIFKEVYRENYISNWRQSQDQGLLIEFCQNGRLEYQIEEEWRHHAEKNVILFRTDRSSRNLRYPLKEFGSIAVAVKTQELSPAFAAYLEQLDLSLDDLIQKYQLDQQLAQALRASEQLERIFWEISDAPEKAKLHYWKVKVLELLLRLTNMEYELEEIAQCRISCAQMTIAREAHRYLLAHLQEHITIKELARLLSTSPTQLKEGFRTVYGAPIQTFVREQRLYAAARLLRESDLKIRDVAETFGYINVSKFSAAFQRVIGMTPAEYRRQARLAETRKTSLRIEKQSDWSNRRA